MNINNLDRPFSKLSLMHFFYKATTFFLLWLSLLLALQSCKEDTPSTSISVSSPAVD